LDQSAKFDAEDQNALSLTNEKGRGLETLGIKKVPEGYLVNEILVDDNKTYSIATTDYVGAGDTGYPDLAGKALNPKTRPEQYPDRLESISGLVCTMLYADQYKNHCLRDIP